MVNRFRKLVVFCVCAALVLVGVVAAAPAGAKPAIKRFVYAKRIADPGTVLRFTVGCPRGWVEMGGDVISNPAAMPVLSSRPSLVESRIMRRLFAFDNQRGTKPAEVRVRITCVKFFPPSRAKRRPVRLGTLIIVKTPFKPVMIRSQRIVTPVCPKRGRLVGPGLEFRRVDGRTETQAAWASVRKTGAAVEVSKSWIAQTKRGEQAEYVVQDSGGLDDYEVRAIGRCLERAATAGGGKGRRQGPYRGPIRIKIPYLRGPVQPGVNRIKASCPKGFLSTGTGFMFPPENDISLFGAFPLDGRGSFWEIDSPAAGPVPVKIQAQCLKARIDWRLIL